MKVTMSGVYRQYRAGHKTLAASGSDVSPVSGWHLHREHHARLLLRLCALCFLTTLSDQTAVCSLYTLKASRN